jgi:antitoxin component HigA of HigAB toxin-antitoxin module
LKAIPTMASRRSPKDAVAGIKSMFLDTNQMVDKLRITVENFEVLAKQLEGLEAELSKSQDAMRTYTEKSSNTRKALDSEIGGMRTKIAKLEKDRDLAYELWLDLTIAAVAVTAAIAIVGVAISVVLGAATVGSGAVIGAGVTAGLTAGAGAALGVAAGVARSSYDGLISDLRDENTLLKKRVAFQHDLGALDSTMQFTLPSSSGLITQVKGMKFGWESLIEEIKEKVGNLTVDNLSDGPWLQQDKMNAASANWTTVDDAIKAFNSNSLIDYDLIEFGSSLPADDPNWEGNLERILAA